jgi:hypothetical protein
MFISYPVYGTWEVTTEGDCEGRTTARLGTHTGFIDEIALTLGAKAYYKLRFKLLADKPIADPKPILVESVSVSLFIDSGTWDMSQAERAETMRKVFKDRPVVIEESPYYASFVIRKEG